MFIATRLDVALAERLRYLIPLSYDRVMAYPHLLFPLSRKLEVLAPEVFLPGVGALPDDFIMAVQTNPRFVEALMVGANHEMGRELLWQGFPTDQRGTPFQHFWQRLDSGKRHRADQRMAGGAARLATRQHSDAGAADSRPVARAFPDAVDLCVSAHTAGKPAGRRRARDGSDANDPAGDEAGPL